MADRTAQWRAVAKAEVPDGTVQIPRTWWAVAQPRLDSHVRIHARNASAALSVTRRAEADGYQVWVPVGTCGLKDDEQAACVVEEISPGAFRRARVLGTTTGRYAVVGLLIAIVGVVLDASLDIGGQMSRPAIVLGEVALVALLWLSTLLEVAGLAIVFIGGVWFGSK